MEKYSSIIQTMLALFFLIPAIVKIKTPKPVLVSKGNMPPDGSIVFIRTLGILELAGCVAMIVPLWIPTLSLFTALAALGFSVVMIAAIPFHVKKKEYKKVPVLFVALCLSVVIMVHYLNF